MSQTWKPHVFRTSKLYYYYYYYYWDVPATYKATDNIVFYNYNYISHIRDGWTNFKFCTLFSFVLRRSVTVPNVILSYTHTHPHKIILYNNYYRNNWQVSPWSTNLPSTATSLYVSVSFRSWYAVVRFYFRNNNVFTSSFAAPFFYTCFYVSSHYF